MTIDFPLGSLSSYNNIAKRNQSINTIVHPCYMDMENKWFKWRLTYEGGDNFIDEYLKKYSLRESGTQFRERRSLAYIPGFATAAVEDIKNAIFQRTSDVTRENGTISYQSCVDGYTDGVDLLGSSMNSFIGMKILPELLPMAKVGVYVDMPIIDGNKSKAEAYDKHPYMYTYRAEDIRSWTYDDTDAPNEFASVLLRDHSYVEDEETGLPVGCAVSYRRLWLVNGQVFVRFYNEKGSPVTEPIGLEIPKIPFHVFDIGNSLLAWTAEYQIALMNLASSDLSYLLLAGFPFYTEQFDPAGRSGHVKVAGQGTAIDIDGNTTGQASGTASDAKAKDQEIKVGPTAGRRYPKGLDRPGFINPSSEPLTIAIEKEEQMKREIRELTNMALSSIGSSAASKQMDQHGLESGLSFIGLVLENGERQLAKFWSMYEGSKQEPTISYPEKYSLKNDEEKRQDAAELRSDMASIPSLSYRKELAKRLAELRLGDKISRSRLDTIRKEIDAAKGILDSVENLQIDLENGLVSPDFGSELRLYPEGQVKKAEEYHARRLARIAEAQSDPNAAAPNPGARGIKERSANPGKAGKSEKSSSRDNTTRSEVKDRTRGLGK